ncbi:MAG: hypothetical protein HY692_07460, partial [Cyanobacteria bacterium NC_groundwater_1444_Ag_S-0.65um_54_12]|nr:hypothetical protein [Cyanobacteria bacterium NC_groundwater_1444_Ag_S-0.65um_54_12]
LRAALEQSVNVIAVNLLQEVGIAKLIELARALGIRSPLAADLTLALGSSAVTPLEMTVAYATIANGGTWVQPSIYTTVKTTTGQVLEQPAAQSRQVADPRATVLLVDVLTGVLTRGTAARQGIARPAAGKTGTTSDFRDAWFVGFVPQLCVAVWVGNDDRRPMRQGAFGGRIAARIWHDLMSTGTRQWPVLPLPAPEYSTPAASPTNLVIPFTKPPVAGTGSSLTLPGAATASDFLPVKLPAVVVSPNAS